MGLHQAGFDVTGVDRTGQSAYPFSFQCERVQRLSVKYLRSFDLIWASPPCQAFSIATKTGLGENADLSRYSNDIPWVRDLLERAGVPSIIENVPQAPLRADVKLCGSMFGLRLVRHRIFELRGFQARQPAHRDHHWKYVTVAGSTGGPNSRREHGRGSLEDWKEAMGIDWMPMRALNQAIPPAYAKYLAEEFLQWTDQILPGSQESGCNGNFVRGDHQDVEGPEERPVPLARQDAGSPGCLQRGCRYPVAADGQNREDLDCQPATAGA